MCRLQRPGASSATLPAVLFVVAMGSLLACGGGDHSNECVEGPFGPGDYDAHRALILSESCGSAFGYAARTGTCDGGATLVIGESHGLGSAIYQYDATTRLLVGHETHGDGIRPECPDGDHWPDSYEACAVTWIEDICP